MDYEILAPLIGLFVALIASVVLLVRALGKSGETNATISAAMIAQTETIIRFNDELQEHSAERKEQEAERQDWRLERVKLEGKILASDAQSTAEIARLDRQIVGLTSQLAQVHQSRTRLSTQLAMLERKVEMLEAENKELNVKVTGMESENNTLRGERILLIEKVDNLKRMLDAEIESNNRLRAELDLLNERIEGDNETPDPKGNTKHPAVVTGEAGDQPTNDITKRTA